MMPRPKSVPVLPGSQQNFAIFAARHAGNTDLGFTRGWLWREKAMFLGFLMMGMAGGLVAGVSALMMGQSIWMALLAYALTGIAGTVLGAIASLIPAPAGQTGGYGESGHMAIEG